MERREEGGEGEEGEELRWASARASADGTRRCRWRVRVHEERQRARFLLRAARWLHLDRGERAWTFVADVCAVGLVAPALSGIGMTPGRKGLLGRGGIHVLVGAAVPVAHVVLSGGP